jgi:hypothetical protein
MSQTKTPAKTWTRPALVRLGVIADVAGGNPNPTQNVNNS